MNEWHTIEIYFYFHFCHTEAHIFVCKREQCSQWATHTHTQIWWKPMTMNVSGISYMYTNILYNKLKVPIPFYDCHWCSCWVGWVVGSWLTGWFSFLFFFLILLIFQFIFTFSVLHYNDMIFDIQIFFSLLSTNIPNRQGQKKLNMVRELAQE